MPNSLFHNEQQLLTGITAGEERAFAELFNQQFSRLNYFALRFVKDWAVASDITAEAFIKLWQGRDQFTAMMGVRAFLHVSVRNACLNYIKSSTLQAGIRRQLLETLEQDEISRLFDDNVEAELLERVYRQIELLPANYARIFKMAYLEGYKNDEIAAMLNISSKTVRNQKSEALRILRLAFDNKELLLLTSVFRFL